MATRHHRVHPASNYLSVHPASNRLIPDPCCQDSQLVAQVRQPYPANSFDRCRGCLGKKLPLDLSILFLPAHRRKVGRAQHRVLELLQERGHLHALAPSHLLHHILRQAESGHQ